MIVDDGTIVGVEAGDAPVPDDLRVTTYDGTLLPGLIDTHVHLVTDSGAGALDRVAGCSAEELDVVVREALRLQLTSGVTTVRDLGDRDFVTLTHRDRRAADEPRVVAAGPPITSRRGHCWYLGGETEGPEGLRAAVRERVERGVDVVKVMASGGVNTEGTDLTKPQFPREELRLLVDEAHAAGLPVAAHAHATTAIRLAVEVGVDSIEHASFLAGTTGLTEPDEADVVGLARSGIAVDPTLGGLSVASISQAPPHVLARMRELGSSPEEIVRHRRLTLRRMAEAGTRFVSGMDAGIQPPKAHGRYAEAVIELAQVVGTTQALVAATATAAEVCRVDEVTGRVAPGLDADLLLVDGDLEADLTALRAPVAVWRRGVLVTER